MTSFVASNQTINEIVQKNNLQHGNYWPAINVAEIKHTQRIPSSVDNGQINEALQTAIYHVEDELANYSKSLPETPGEKFKHHYRQAVYNYAMSILVEDYRTLTSTGSGHRYADEMDNRVDDYRRRSKQAIARITGVSKTQVELI